MRSSYRERSSPCSLSWSSTRSEFKGILGIGDRGRLNKSLLLLDLLPHDWPNAFNLTPKVGGQELLWPANKASSIINQKKVNLTEGRGTQLLDLGDPSGGLASPFFLSSLYKIIVTERFPARGHPYKKKKDGLFFELMPLLRWDLERVGSLYRAFSPGMERSWKAGPWSLTAEWD